MHRTGVSMFKEFCKMVRESLQDNATGRYSHARILSMLVALAATVFMWKLIILGGMALEYFIAYLAYGAGHQSLNKFLDNRDTTRVTDAETRRLEAQRVADRQTYESESASSARISRARVTREEIYTDDDLPRPPRNY